MNWRKLLKPFKEKDSRVTAPMIPWWIIFVVLGIMILLVTAQTFIVEAFLDRIGALAGVLTAYLAFVCFTLVGVIWLVWRKTTGKPLQKIARAAKKVADGDFSVQIPVSQKKRKMNEMDVLIEDFNKMIQELNGNEMLKSDFISNVSHEIKAPLSLIQSYTKALRDDIVPQGHREQYMNTVIEATERLNIMISNILKLSKLENQQIFPERKTYQLGEQLRRCALRFMDRWQEKEIEFEIDVADVAVHYDDTLLELVWNNLLSNAVKYTDKGGTIRLTSRKEENKVIVVVEDSGCGMDAETCRRVFEKFYQGDTSHASEGNGLGMALAKKVVDIAGGCIRVESSLGKGSRFTVELNI